MLKRVLEKLECWIGIHNWTCKAAQGIKPTKEELTAGLLGFYQYATMYCARCGKISRLNSR